MLARVKSVQVVVARRSEVVPAYEKLLGCEVVAEDRVRVVSARRTILALGASRVELLEPDGSGEAADFLARSRGGLFAVGLATFDLGALRAHLLQRGAALAEEAGQIFLTPEAVGVPGLRAVLTAEQETPPVGLLRHLYEATLLVPDATEAVDRAAATFSLNRAHFVPIRSAEYGYEGVLTLFAPDRLDRIEIITPTDPEKTMGRFFARRDPSLYMCYAESDDLSLVRARLEEHAPTHWTGPREGALDNLFIHPPALGGMMLGVSRTSFAWVWSGQPGRVAEQDRS